MSAGARHNRPPPLPAPLAAALEAAPEQFDFFAVMRALEAGNPQAPRIGDSGALREEYVTLGQDPFLVFPASNLSKATADRAGRLRVLVRFLGLLGPQGALPLTTTDEALTYLSRDDEALARFLDLFNNRFLQLFFRAWADARPIAQADRPREDRFRAYIGASIGLGSPLAADLDSVPDAVKLRFAGLMGAQAKSATRLAALLTGVFGTRCEIEEFVGSWLLLPFGERSRLGGENAALGGALMLGERMFSVADKFRIRIHAATLAEYETYLPTGPRAEHLSDLVTFHLGEALDWDVELALPAREAKPMVLGRTGRLGWTSWMAPDWSVSGDTIRRDARFHVHMRVRQARAAREAREPASEGARA
ncbi:MAG: type VI secretion system baseplate subunit TssG [Hyphomicrobiales bacterium]|nr:type VI secretion system baseplate subunit TssG [Hyphomicrobiales bacterium]